MHKILELTICFLMMFSLSGCVTTSDSIVVEAPGNNEAIETLETLGALETNGVFYSGRGFSGGPLLLGSKEYMEGSIAEFSVLYSLYFSLSSIIPTEHRYKISQGTRWQIDSEQLEEPVFFERALLNEDDEKHSWWYFLVEGEGFRREYEFLLEKDWSLMELRYKEGEEVKKYIPSSYEKMSNADTIISYDEYIVGKERIETEAGDFQADHIVFESIEYWIHQSVPGTLVKTVITGNENIILTASIIEIKEEYNTVLNSY